MLKNEWKSVAELRYMEKGYPEVVYAINRNTVYTEIRVMFIDGGFFVELRTNSKISKPVTTFRPYHAIEYVRVIE